MKFILASLLLFVSCIANTQDIKRIGIIEIYGDHSIPREQVLKAIGINEGDSVYIPNKKFIEQKLQSIPGVRHTDLSIVCCNNTAFEWTIYIGLSAKELKPAHKAPPQLNVSLPANGKQLYDELGKMIEEAVTNQQATENDSAGYAWLNYPPARPVQEKMLEYAKQYYPELRSVLMQAKDPNERAAAAWIIAFGNNKIDIANTLLFAVKDPDDEVRNNATRALSVLASYANEHPDAGIHIPAEPFINMINSIVWTDRNKGTSVLMGLTAKRSPELLKLIKQKALNSLIQMARWKGENHAFMSYILLARIAGMPDEQIFSTFYSDKRHNSIDSFISTINAKN